MSQREIEAEVVGCHQTTIADRVASGMKKMIALHRRREAAGMSVHL
jgi:hypothetical protein